MKNKNNNKLYSVMIAISFFCLCCAPVSAFSIPFKKKNKQIKQTQSPVEVTVQKDKVLSYSIDECVDIALKNDPNIQIYTSKKEITDSQVGIAKSDYFPNLMAGAGFTSQHNKNTGRGGGFYNQGGSTSQDNNYYQINLGVNQLIWDFGKTISKINMQKYNRESAQYDLENAVLNTVYNVKTAYYSVLAAEANTDVFERSVRINKLNYERTNALFKEGLKSKIDVVNAHVYLTDAQISLIEAQGQYQNAIVKLNNSMYFTKAPKYALKNTESFNFQTAKHSKNSVNISYTPKSGSDKYEQTAILTSGVEKQDILQNYKFKPLILAEDEAIEKAYANRPDLKSLLMVERAQKESLKEIKRSYLPVLSASSNYVYRKNSDVANTGFNIGASLDFNSLNFMDMKYKIKQGNSYLKMAGQNIDLSKKNIYFEVQTNYINMVTLQKKILLMSQKVSQAFENFELADGRYTVGIGNFIELQQAQTNYNNAQLSFVKAVFDYNVAKEQFQKSMGVR